MQGREGGRVFHGVRPFEGACGVGGIPVGRGGAIVVCWGGGCCRRGHRRAARCAKVTTGHGWGSGATGEQRLRVRLMDVFVFRVGTPGGCGRGYPEEEVDWGELVLAGGWGWRRVVSELLAGVVIEAGVEGRG